MADDSTPQIDVPGEVVFNLDTPGVSFESQTVTIGNTGDGVLEISSITTPSDHFTVDVPADLTEIAPGGTADIIVTFRPVQNFNTIGSSLRIRSNTGGSFVRSTFVRLRGNNPLRQTNDDEDVDDAPAPLLIVSGNGVFNLDTPGQSTLTQNFTLRNDGDAAFLFGSIQTSTPNFTVDVPAGLTQLAPGASVVIPVTYQPVDALPNHSDNLTITSNTTNPSVSNVQLSGNNPLGQFNGADGGEEEEEEEEEVFDGTPLIEAPATVQFDLNTPGVTTQTQTVTISNVGDGVLEIREFDIFSRNFVLNDAPEGLVELNPGESLDLSVTYSPQSTSSRHFGNLNVFANSGGSSSVTRIRLRGTNPLRQTQGRSSASQALDSDFVNTTQGVNKAAELSVSIFPNPVENTANVRIAAPQSVESVTMLLMSQDGRTVRRLQVETYGNTTVPVDVADLTAGLYLLRVIDNKGDTASTAKLLKQ